MDTENARLSELGYKAELSRSLSLTDVVIYGLNYMVPIAPISVFGVVYNLSLGELVRCGSVSSEVSWVWWRL